MAFDGITVSNIVYELNNTLADGRISKIAQPEKDELQLTIKAVGRTVYRLMISANASLPLIYITDENKPSPLNAPGFCMLLRKHLSGAKIIGVTQFGMERVINFELEHLDELGDLCRKYLIVELMGKHSNIIFCEKEDDKLRIIDSIKRISSFVSSVREVLPGRDYFIPNTMEKYNPLAFDDEIMSHITEKPVSLQKAIYTTLTGFSPIAAHEICERAGLNGDVAAGSLDNGGKLNLYSAIDSFVSDIKNNLYTPCIVYDGDKPIEFGVFNMTCYSGMHTRTFDTVSEMLICYYSEKNNHTRIKQKSSDLRRIVSTALERNRKKLDLQLRQFKDTEKRDKYKVYGELLTTYGYSAAKGDKELVCNNYYTGEDIEIPLNTELSPIDNAKKYFDRYSKLKRTYDALKIQIEETKSEIDHLESISNSLDIATMLDDLNIIKEEMTASGYIRKNTGNRKKQQKTPASKPLHYVSSDGFDIYVGKNNYQNDELTFGNQSQGDWWFHSKGIAGSHVVLKSAGRKVSDRAFEEAASLAAYYSKGRESGRVEIDYTELKNVKKPKGSKPGFVVYYTNYSMVAPTAISDLKEIID
ncbi:MAG: fibronectin/fibrinogen-binding protein [Lachnospiraceae bacterium]|nr:fibronectin/fibrinogen-binding protein [Lachnospiraceae bacterium]